MKRILIFLFILVTTVAFAQEKKARVGVLDFTAVGVSQTEALTIGSMFRGDLVSSKAYDVLDRNNMDNILEEQEFQTTGCTEASCAVEIGKLLNMEYMIYGSVSKLGENYVVQTEMINIETSQIAVSARKIFSSIEESDKASRDIVEEITIKLRGGDTMPEKKEPEKQVNKAKGVLIISSLSLGALGGVANGLAYFQGVASSASYDKYSSITFTNGGYYTPEGEEVSPDSVWQEVESKRRASIALYVASFSTYGLALSGFIAGLIIPKYKEIPSVSFLPRYGENGGDLLISINY